MWAKIDTGKSLAAGPWETGTPNTMLMIIYLDFGIC